VYNNFDKYNSNVDYLSYFTVIWRVFVAFLCDWFWLVFDFVNFS